MTSPASIIHEDDLQGVKVLLDLEAWNTKEQRKRLTRATGANGL